MFPLLFRLFQRGKSEPQREWFEDRFTPVPKEKPADCKGCAFDGKTINGKMYCSHLQCSCADHEPIKSFRWEVVKGVNWKEAEDWFKNTSVVKALSISRAMIQNKIKKR